MLLDVTTTMKSSKKFSRWLVTGEKMQTFLKEVQVGSTPHPGSTVENEGFSLESLNLKKASSPQKERKKLVPCFFPHLFFPSQKTWGKISPSLPAVHLPQRRCRGARNTLLSNLKGKLWICLNCPSYLRPTQKKNTVGWSGFGLVHFLFGLVGGTLVWNWILFCWFDGTWAWVVDDFLLFSLPNTARKYFLGKTDLETQVVLLAKGGFVSKSKTGRLRKKWS